MPGSDNKDRIQNVNNTNQVSDDEANKKPHNTENHHQDQQENKKPGFLKIWKESSKMGKALIVFGGLLALAGVAFAALGIAAAAGAAGALAVMAAFGGTTVKEQSTFHDTQGNELITLETHNDGKDLDSSEVLSQSFQQSYTPTQSSVTSNIVLTGDRGTFTAQKTYNAQTLETQDTFTYTDSQGVSHDVDVNNTTVAKDESLNDTGKGIIAGTSLGGTASGAGMVAAGSKMKQKTWLEKVESSDSKAQEGGRVV